MAEIIAIIPARGGSTRIKRKNIYPILGKPLIAYSIEVAFSAGIFSKVLVNSDNDEILSVASEYGAIPYKRDKKLGSDKVFVIQVIQEMIKNLKISSDSVIGILLPTAPLRTKEDILNAFAIFKENGENIPVVSVSRFFPPIQLAQFIEQNRLVPVFPEDYTRSTKSTAHTSTYYYNEVIIFNTAQNLLKQNNLIGNKPIAYVMPPERSIIIDYPFQLKLVEILLKNREEE